jgi:hypothetical protein
MDLNIKCWYKKNGNYYALNVEGKNIDECRNKFIQFLAKKDIDFNSNDFGEIETLKDIKISKIKETGITIC